MNKILFSLFLLGQITIAQNKTEKDTTKTIELDNVFVTANRTATLRKETPVAISKITPKTIDETKATVMSEIINKTPGVLMTNAGNEGHMMSIRQPITTNAYYLYLEDGIPIRPMGVFNHNALLEINQFNLQSVEVIKGPASSLYGPEAVGGTVNFISLKPSIDPEFKFGIQSDNYGNRRFQAAGGTTIGKIGFHLAGISTIQENGWMPNSDYTKNNFNARIDYNITEKTRLISNTMWGKYDSKTNGSANEDDFYNRTYKNTTPFAYRNSDALRTRLTLEHDWNANANSYITAYYRDNTLEQNPSYAIKWNPTVNPTQATGEVNSNSFKSYGAIGQHTQKFDFWNTKLVSGALYDYSPVTYWAYLVEMLAVLNPGNPGKQTVNHYEITTERPDVRLTDYTADIYNSAVYTQVSLQPIQQLTITADARYDNMKINYNNALDKSIGTKIYDKPTFKVGINYNPIQNTGIYANYAQGFSPPGITSIFKAKPGTGGTTGVPAEFYYNLEPATFNNYEMGGWLALLDNKLSFDYAVYYMEGKNELLSVKLADNSTDYRSVGQTSHKGIELGGNYRFLNNQLNFRFGGTVSKHTYVDFQLSDKPSDPIQNLNGKEMPLAPKWNGNSELSYYPNWLPKFRTSIEWQTVGNYYQDQINTVKYAGYDIFNFRAGYKWRRIEIYGNIMNLTDKIYTSYVSRANTSSSQPSYTAMPPRTFLVGLQYNFSLKNN